jgi:hypothetical protein
VGRAGCFSRAAPIALLPARKRGYKVIEMAAATRRRVPVGEEVRDALLWQFAGRGFARAHNRGGDLFGLARNILLVLENKPHG